MRTPLLVALLCTACAVSHPAPHSPSSTPAAARALLADEVAAGTVALISSPPPPWEHGGNAYLGVGICLGAGRVLTARHLVQFATTITLVRLRYTADHRAGQFGRSYHAQTIATTAGFDAALLEGGPDYADCRPLDIAVVQPRDGDAVYALLPSAGWSQGKVTHDDFPMPEHDGLMETDIRTVGGDSGAPLVNAHGELVGFLSRGRNDGTRSYFMPALPALAALQQSVR